MNDHDEHIGSIIAGVNKRELCDVVLCAEDQELPSHVVLHASLSQYFEVMCPSGMAEEAKDRVTLKGVRADQLLLILDFIYTGTIDITDSNMKWILYAADYLHVAGVKDTCGLLGNQMQETQCRRISLLAVGFVWCGIEDEGIELYENCVQQETPCDEFLQLLL